MQEFERARRLFHDGISHFRDGRFDAAEAAFVGSLDLVPDRPSTLVNLAATRLRLGKAASALKAAAHALRFESANADAWFHNGTALDALGNRTGAVAAFRKAVELRPDHFEARLNLGAVLADLGEFREALAACDGLLAMRPDCAEAWSNKGVALAGLSRPDEALAHYARALALRPTHAPTLANAGVLLNQLRRHEEALTHLEEARRLEPGIDFLIGQIAVTKMSVGDWQDLGPLLAQIESGIEAGRKVAAPFWCLAMFDSTALHLAAAKIWIRYKVPAGRAPDPFAETRRAAGPDRIRVGYFSADFRQHPVGVAAAELFELHDRRRFEIHAFSLHGAAPGDPLRRRFERSFDSFLDVTGSTDAQIAELARARGLDIAVDLGGHTEAARTGIFAHRAAPVQIAYLGYPASTGADYMDYIVADTTVLPTWMQAEFSEKPIYLPDMFMPDDSTRPVADGMPSRETAGLPERGFVFCCFNASFKISRDMVDVWSGILNAVAGSVLWLAGASGTFERNLVAAFAARSVSTDRIRFAPRLPSPADHLARLRLADLFLDTLPYNAHSTAIDALRVGLPVLTCLGTTFAGRVASSLLGAVGLPELSTPNMIAYADTAIAFARNPDRLQAVRRRFAASRATAPMFDTRRYARHLEDGYMQAVARRQAGLPPSPIFVRRLGSSSD